MAGGRLNARLEQAGRRFARLATDASVARPGLWRLFRRPLRAQFDRLAPVWEGRVGPEGLAPLLAALERVEASPRRVLDLGTGTGKAARAVAARFSEAEVDAVDLSPAMIAEARRLLPPELATRVRFAVADASALPFPDGTFDLAVLLNMIPFPGELARVVAPAALVVFAFSFGPGTPIYVPPETLRARLAPLGFGRFEELAAGTGTALLAYRIV